jgi:hypothetical protein
MEQTIPLEADSCSADQKRVRLLWDPVVHYRVHIGSLMDPILRQFNPVHSLFLQKLF